MGVVALPWNGSGLFVRLYSWVADKNAGIDINSSRMDADTNDIVTGLDNTVTLDGQTVPTHSLPMGGFNHTNVGNATGLTQYIAAGQVQNSSLVWGGTSGGSANAQTIALTPVMTAIATGVAIRFTAGFSNSSAATLTVNATAATAIRKKGLAGPVALSGGEILVGNIYEVVYDGTYYELQSQMKSPTTQVFTSGSGTYTKPGGATWIEVELIGAGAGGGGSGAGATNGAAGGDTTFSTMTGAGGSAGGAGGGGGGGGSATGGDLNISGGAGMTGGLTSATAYGAMGGISYFGGAGMPGLAGVGNQQSPVANTGSGGPGAQGSGAVNNGGGGGAGAYCRKIFSSPSATYAYGVGAAGAGGSSGTGGAGAVGGASGVIIVKEYYQ